MMFQLLLRECPHTVISKLKSHVLTKQDPSQNFEENIIKKSRS